MKKVSDLVSVDGYIKKKVKFPILTHPEQDNAKLKKKGVSISAILDRVRKRVDGTFTVRIMVIYNRFPKYYSTKINMTEDTWLKLCDAKRLNPDLKSKEIIIHEFLRKSIDIVCEVNTFSFEAFEKQFHNQRSDKNNVFDYYTDYISTMNGDGRVGTASSYQCSLNSLKKFVDKPKLLFSEITPSFLERYEKWMKANNKTTTTVGIYLRPLRHLYKKAISERNAQSDNYPFSIDTSDMKFRIPAPNNIKKALKKADIKTIYEYSSKDGSPEHFYRDLWMFSYLCNGMNLKDVCLLQYGNIKGDHIYFNRAKTMHTKKDGKQIDIIITDKVNEIIDRWGVKPSLPDNFIFPFLKDGMTPLQQQAQIRQVTKQCNKYIKRICKNIGIEANVSTYTARHSYATILKRGGVDVAFISDALGHSNIKVTESYLGSFEDEAKKEIAKTLTDW
jgi:site-specific recombinase XerD